MRKKNRSDCESGVDGPRETFTPGLSRIQSARKRVRFSLAGLVFFTTRVCTRDAAGWKGSVTMKKQYYAGEPGAILDPLYGRGHRRVSITSSRNARWWNMSGLKLEKLCDSRGKAQRRRVFEGRERVERRRGKGEGKNDKERKRETERKCARGREYKVGVSYIKIAPSTGADMSVGPFYSSDILSGPLAGPIRAPMLQSASEHGRNQISGTAMRIDSRPPDIKRERRVARTKGLAGTAILRRAFRSNSRLRDQSSRSIPLQ